jgi:hypothetical protein
MRALLSSFTDVLMRRRFAILAACTCLTAGLHASAPVYWSTMTSADFLKGDATGVSIDTLGRVTLGPGVTPVVDLETAATWRMAAAPDGTVFVAAGNDGKVMRVDTAGKATVAFDAVESQVHAIAVTPDGQLLAGSSPDGRIVRVARDGATTTVFDPAERYIWALAVDADGTVFAATGDKAVVYRIPPGGDARVIYTAKATHVTALALAPGGGVFIGTDTPGQVIRLSRDGNPFILLDSPHREIRALRVDASGTLFVAAMSAKGAGEARAADPPPASTAGGAVAAFSTEITVTASGDATATTPTPAATVTRGTTDKRDAKGAVYRIAADGTVDVVWDAADDLPYDIVPTPEGVVVATAAKGRLVRVAGEAPRVTLLTRLDAQQITGILPARGGDWWVLGANPGKLWKVGATAATTGQLMSDVRDATVQSTWGTVRWSGTTPSGTSVALATRSGNTATPDETWSPWSAAIRNPAGETITSPKARYIQWRLDLTGAGGASPSITGVTLAYLPRNARPIVSAITVHPPGIVFQRPYSTGEFEIAGFESGASDGKTLASLAAVAPAQTQPALGRKTYQRGLRTFQWKADDEASDRVRFDVFYRREGDAGWTPLRREMWDPLLAWDTSSVADGTYTLRVVASDGASNPAATALTGEAESSAFDVDNTPPSLQVERAAVADGRLRATVRVRDAQSPVERVEYSVDAMRWTVVFPTDGVADSGNETYDIEVAAADAPNGLRVRAADALDNPASVTIALPKR